MKKLWQGLFGTETSWGLIPGLIKDTKVRLKRLYLLLINNEDYWDKDS
jgi:hypothetical protein